MRVNKFFVLNRQRVCLGSDRLLCFALCFSLCMLRIVSAERFELEVHKSSPGPSPLPRFNSAVQSCVARNEVVVFGGRSKTSTLNDTWVFNTVRKSWQEVIERGPSPRHQTLSALIDFGGSDGKYFYIFGGKSSNFVLEEKNSYIWAFSLASKKWTAVDFNSSSPTGTEDAKVFPRAAAVGGVTEKNDIIISHGEGISRRLSDAYLLSFLNPFSAFVREEIYGNIGTLNIGDPRSLSQAASVVTAANELVVFGGCYQTGLCPNQDSWSFDIFQKQWRYLKRGPSPRLFASAARALPTMESPRQTVVLWGGLEKSKQILSVEKSSPLEIDVLDVRAKTWRRELASVFGPGEIQKLYGSSMVIVGSGKPSNPWRYLIFGGIDSNGEISNEVVSLTFNANRSLVLVSKKIARVRGYLYLHGILMFTAFAILLPLGFGVARYVRHMTSSPKWFMMHSGTQVVGVSFAWVGTVLAILGANDRPYHLHAICGIIVMTLCTLQVLFGAPCLRPNPNAGFKRQLWSMGHQVIGWTAVLLGWLTSLVGMVLLVLPVGVWITFTVFFFVLVAGIMACEIRRFSRRDHKEEKYIRDDDSQGLPVENSEAYDGTDSTASDSGTT